MSTLSLPVADDIGLAENRAATQFVRGLVWVYLLFLLFEGALRKWIAPGLSAELLIVRDPIVVWIYVCAVAAGVFPTGKWMASFWILLLGSALFGLLAEHCDWKTYLFGLRTNFLHLPLIFVIARCMKEADVVKMGRWVLLLSIPMTFLVVQQFQAAPDSILNTSVGGTARQLESAGGKVRASGTFSFISGVVSYYSLVCAFLVNSLLRPGTYARWLHIVATAGLVIAVSTSGSRAAVAAVLIVVAAVGMVLFSNPAMLGRVLIALALTLLVTALTTHLFVVQEGLQNLSQRFDEAGGSGGFWPRLVGGLSDPFIVSARASFFGYGLGYGTNAGAALAATGASPFALGESEWQRVIMESGPFMGNLFILWRLALVVYLFRVGLGAIRRGQVLPLLLASASGFLIMNGQFGQPTILGFAALGGGLCLASAQQTRETAETRESDAAPHELVRSRSRYAKILHGVR